MSGPWIISALLLVIQSVDGKVDGIDKGLRAVDEWENRGKVMSVVFIILVDLLNFNFDRQFLKL